MAKVKAKRSMGTTLNINGTTKVAGLKSIGGLQLTAETIDTTTLDSDGGYREFIGGFRDGGEVALEGIFDPADDNGQSKMYELFESGIATPFTIKFPDGMSAEWSFDGVVTAFGTSASLDDVITFSATIKVSGKPEFTVTE